MIGVGFREMITGGCIVVGGNGIAGEGCGTCIIGNDCCAGFTAVPLSVLWIPMLKVVPACSSSPMACVGGGIFDGPGSLGCNSLCPSPSNPGGRSSLGFVKYCLRALFQLRPYQQLLIYSISNS